MRCPLDYLTVWQCFSFKSHKPATPDYSIYPSTENPVAFILPKEFNLQIIVTFAHSLIYTKETQYKDSKQLHQAFFVPDLVIEVAKKKNPELDWKLQELTQHMPWQRLHLLVRNRSMAFSLRNTMFWHYKSAISEISIVSYPSGEL